VCGTRGNRNPFVRKMGYTRNFAKKQKQKKGKTRGQGRDKEKNKGRENKGNDEHLAFIYPLNETPSKRKKVKQKRGEKGRDAKRP